MNFTKKMMQIYFNYAYNPVYDFTTGRLNRYRHLQERCVGMLQLEDNTKVLCVGLGTGNEISHILEKNRNVRIAGIDYSHTALKKASKKALALGKEIELFLMDARLLQLPSESFDSALCVHVMDFVEENEKVTDEILRVLVDGGQYVITYPSDKEGLRLGVKLLNDNIRHRVYSGKYRYRILLEFLGQMLLGIIYLPLLLRPKQKSYSISQLEAMLKKLMVRDYHIETDPVYQDYIVCGRKYTKRE